MQEGGRVLFKNCTFLNNSASLSRGVATASLNVTMKIENSTFVNNTATLTGVILAENNATVNITTSTFLENSGTQRCLFYMDSGTKLYVYSSNFHNNTGSRLIFTVGDAELYVVNCNFTNHFLTAGTLIIVKGSNLTIVNTTFQNNSQFNDAGIVAASYYSHVFVTSSLFVQNSAAMGGVFWLATGASLWLNHSILINNTGGNGGVAFLHASSAMISDCMFENSKSIGNGGVLTSVNSSNLIVRNSLFVSNQATYGGCFCLEKNSSLEVYDSLFKNNYAREGGVLRKIGFGNVSIENCTFDNNSGIYGESIYSINMDTLRISQGLCIQANKTSIKFDCRDGLNNCKLHTNNFTFINSNTTLNSRRNETFFQQARKNNFIDREGEMQQPWLETPFASCECFHLP